MPVAPARRTSRCSRVSVEHGRRPAYFRRGLRDRRSILTRLKFPLLHTVVLSLARGVSRNRTLAVCIAVGWVLFEGSRYPLAYLFSWDSDIWFVQLGTLMLILVEALALAALVCLAVSVVGSSGAWRKLEGRLDDATAVPERTVLRSNVLQIRRRPRHRLPASGGVPSFGGDAQLAVARRGSLLGLRKEYPALRSGRDGAAGIPDRPVFTNYFYCDIQRLFHALVRPLGLTLQRDPELYLRLLSLLAFVAAVVLLYVRSNRESRSWWWTVASTLAFSAAPLFLFYAFEARVYEFSTLAVIAYLAVFAAALRKPDSRRLWMTRRLSRHFGRPPARVGGLPPLFPLRRRGRPDHPLPPLLRDPGRRLADRAGRPGRRGRDGR